MASTPFIPGKRRFSLRLAAPQTEPFTIGLPYPKCDMPLISPDTLVIKEEGEELQSFYETTVSCHTTPIRSPSTSFHGVRSGGEPEEDATTEDKGQSESEESSLSPIPSTSREVTPLDVISPMRRVRNHLCSPPPDFILSSRSPTPSDVPDYSRNRLSPKDQVPQNSNDQGSRELVGTSSGKRNEGLVGMSRIRRSMRFAPYAKGSHGQGKLQKARVTQRVHYQEKKINKLEVQYHFHKSTGDEPIEEPPTPGDIELHEYSVFVHVFKGNILGWIWRNNTLIRRSPRKHRINPYASRGCQPRPLTSEPAHIVKAQRRQAPPLSIVIPRADGSPTPSLPSPFTVFIRATGNRHPLDPPPPPRAYSPGSPTPEDRIEELEKENRELKRENKHLSTQLNGMKADVTRLVTCPICFGYETKIYTMSPCGHSVCLACLVQWFKVTLDRQMGEWFDEHDDRANPPEFMLFEEAFVPETDAQRTQIWREVRVAMREYFTERGLREDRADRRAMQVAMDLFTYACPLCNGVIRNAPGEALFGRDVYDIFDRYVLRYMLHEERPDEVEEATLEMFDPLFMRADSVFREAFRPIDHA
ncbi:hypothetical protein ONZ45_g16722 [Pleurotus djamor]|nr:hypothetical protein ONZ45_g16722 [Pleurotus djamor]